MSELFNTHASPELTRRVKGWARAHLCTDENTAVLVTELTCSEPGCPPRETVIALMHDGAEPEKHTIHLALADIAEADIVALAGTRRDH